MNATLTVPTTHAPRLRAANAPLTCGSDHATQPTTDPVPAPPQRSVPRTAAGERALRRRARAVAKSRPHSGVLPSGTYRGGVRSAGSAGLGNPVRSHAPSRQLVRLAATVVIITALGVAAIRVMAPSMSTHLETVPVGPGDTLWGIAAAAQPNQDPRAVIDQIRRLNGLTGQDIRPGQVLEVPVVDAR